MAAIQYLDIDTWISGKLKGNAALVALLGNAGKIGYGYEQVKAFGFPAVTYRTESQLDTIMGFWDDVQQRIDAIVEITVWSPWNVNYVATCKAVDAVMKANEFSLLFAGEIPDTIPGLRHEVLRYRRDGIADSDLV